MLIFAYYSNELLMLRIRTIVIVLGMLILLVGIQTVLQLLPADKDSSSVYNLSEIRSAVTAQMESYPESTLKDLYKNFFQDAFGPGHLKPSGDDGTARMRNYLMSETAEAQNEPSLCSEYETIGYHGRFYRADLELINSGKVPFDTFFSAFSKSAESFELPPLDSWKEEWSVIEGVIRDLYPSLAGYEADKAEIDALLESGEYASHHSEQYQKAYRPHYRLIEKSIFEAEILPLL